MEVFETARAIAEHEASAVDHTRRGKEAAASGGDRVDCRLAQPGLSSSVGGPVRIYWTCRRTGAAQLVEYIRFERVVHVEARAGVDSSGGGGLPSPLRFGSTKFESEPYDEDVIPGFWYLQRYRKT